MSMMTVSDAAYDGHCRHIDAALAHFEDGQFNEALVDLDAALGYCDSPNARWNRAQALLALGRYREGFEGYAARWQLFRGTTTERGIQLKRDLPEWRGESLRGKRLVIIHEGGFGDTIMLLRLAKQIDAEVVLEMPPELVRLAVQIAPMVGEVGERDVQCSMFDLPRLLGTTPETVPAAPYLQSDIEWRKEWRHLVASEYRLKIGIAWSTTRAHGAKRSVPLAELIELVGPHNALYSLQAHDREAAEAHGVAALRYGDFADVAAVASLMNRIVAIDTSALHVAGAIGHPDVTALLPSVPCWRWHNGAPWYPRVKIRTWQFH